jgi:uncharacterized protein
MRVVFAETAAKLRSKFDQSEEDVREALRIVSRAAEIVKPRERIGVLDDGPDNRILECAVAGAADLVVSGDRHLLDVRRFRRSPVVRLADFLRTFRVDTGTARTRGGQTSRRPSRSKR